MYWLNRDNKFIISGIAGHIHINTLDKKIYGIKRSKEGSGNTVNDDLYKNNTIYIKVWVACSTDTKINELWDYYNDDPC